MGGLSPLYSVRPKAYFGKKASVCFVQRRHCGVCYRRIAGIKFMVRDVVNLEMGKVLDGKNSGKGIFVYVRGSGVTGKGEKTPSHEEDSSEEPEGSQGSPPVKGSSGDEHEDLESHLIRKRKASPEVKDKASEISAAYATHVVETSPLRANGTSRLKQPEDLHARSLLAPLLAEGLTVPYVPKWKITTSTVVETPETARDFIAHAIPPPHRFMNFALDPDLFDDQYSMSICEGFFKGADMLQRVNELRKINEGLLSELNISHTVAAELRCQVTDSKRKLLEEKRKKAWEREQRAWKEEKEDLVAELKHHKEAASVSRADVENLYTDWGMAMDDNQKLARERHWLISQGFGLFLSAFSRSEEFRGSLERVYRAYRDVGYQAGLKDGYSYSSQGLKRKETPLYNKKAKKQLAKLDKEFGEKTPALLEKILENPLMSLDELKTLLTPTGTSSPKSLSGEGSP
ncbi:hypothetical protein HanPI659440_Chr13g0515991 [Helianthus annuus]|nr:hypothetical protein HanPI659440_Chr13g0515991 [Helianthus annuus]